MGLRKKVTITLVIIALTQIACRHCMPRTPRKASLKRNLNDLKPVKSNPVSTPYSPSKVNKKTKLTFGKTVQNGRNSQDSQPNKSLYTTYNFPETEYPLDNTPRDPFRIGMNFNENNHVKTLQKARNIQSSAINDLKKEKKMKRKLLSNKLVNNENRPLKTDMSSIKIASNPDSVCLLDSETFPEVQYPLNTMETWGQNYWNYLPITQEKQSNGFGQQAFNPKAREGKNKPISRLTKAKASKFLQSYDKLKEDHRRTSTENSKRSSIGQKGLNFTKTATCERVSDDFITAGLLSNSLGNPSDTKIFNASTTDVENSAENTCPNIENLYQTMPLPYKVIEKNIENVCPAFDLKNNTEEFEDVDSDIIVKTLQLIEEILLNDDTSSKEPPENKETKINLNTTETENTDGAKNKDILINPINNTDTFIVVPIEELLQKVSDDALVDMLPNKQRSCPEDTILENTTATGPLNGRKPVPFTEPITYDAPTNALSPELTNTTILSNVNTVPGCTSIIIIPVNNDAVGQTQSHISETTSDTPIIVYLPSTQLSSILSQTSLNHIVSSSLGDSVPNNQLKNVLSNMAPVHNDNPSSTALVSDLLNSISESGPSLPIHETLPTNSKCYNNENSPSSSRENPILDILVQKSLIDDASFVTPSWDKKKSQETDNFVMAPDTLPETPDLEHLVCADSDITSLRHGTSNNVLNNELPVIARVIDLDQQITKTPSKDLLSQNIGTEHLHKMTSMESDLDYSLFKSPKGVKTMALETDFPSTDSLEILKNLPDPVSNLPESTDKSIFISPISKIGERLQPIDEKPPTILVDASTVELSPPTESSLTTTPLPETVFDKLPEIIDTVVPASDITSNRSPQPIDDNPVPSSILNSNLMTTDLTVKTELYKIRQILDRMLSSGIPTGNQLLSMDTTLSPISETDKQLPPFDKVLSPISNTDNLPLLENQSLSPTQTPSDIPSLPAEDKTFLPLPMADSTIYSLELQDHETLPATPFDDTSKDSLPAPPNQTPSDIPSLPAGDKTLLPLPVADSTIYSLELQDHETFPATPFDDTSKDSLPAPPTQTPSDIPSLPAGDKTLLPLPVADSTIYSLELQDHETLPVTPFDDTSKDSLPAPPTQTPSDIPYLPAGDKTLLPLPVADSTIYSLELQDHETLPATPFDDTSKDSLPAPPTQTPSDIPYLPAGDKTLLPLPVADSTIYSLELQDHETLPATPFDDTSKDSLPAPPNQTPSDIPSLPAEDKTFLPLPMADSTIYSLELQDHETLPATPFDDTSKDSLPAPPTQTPSDIPSLPAGDKTLLPLPVADSTIYSLELQDHETLPATPFDDTSKDSLPAPPTQTPSDIPSLPAGDKTLLPLPVADSTIYSLELQDHETLPATPFDDTSKDSVPAPLDELLLSISNLESTNSPPLSVDDTLPPLLVFEDPVDNKPYLMDNLVTPLSETVTSRTKVTPNNDLPHTVKDLPFKMDFEFPDIYEVCNDDLPLSIDNLPIKGHQVNSESPLSMVDLPMDVVEPPNLLPKTPVSDLLKPTEVLSLSVEKVPSPVFPSNNYKSSMSDSMENEQQDYPPSKDPFNDLSTMPIDKFTPIHEVITNKQFHEISSDIQPQKYDLPQSLDKIITEVSLSDALSINPFVISDSPSPVTDKILAISNSTTDTKDTPLVDNRLLSPKDDANSDTLATGISTTVLKSEVLQSTHLDEARDEVLLESTISDLHRDDLPLPEDKALPLPDNTLTNLLPSKTLSTSKLLITKALLENVLSDIPKGVLYSKEAKPLPVTPPSQTKEIPLMPVENSFPNAEHNENLFDNYLYVSQIKEETPTTDYSFESPLPMVENKNETETSDNLSDNQPLRKDEISPVSDVVSDILRKEKLSSSKLLITKALLENVLAELNTKGFSEPVSKTVPATPSLVLDKTCCYNNSPLSDVADSPLLAEDEIFPDAALTENKDISTEMSSLDKAVANSNDDETSSLADIPLLPKHTPSDPQAPKETASFSKLRVAKALLEHVLKEITAKGFSLPVASDREALLAASRSQLDKTLYFLESPRPDTNEKSSLSNVPTENDNYPEINEDRNILPLSADKVLPDNPIIDTPSDEDNTLFLEELAGEFLSEMEKQLSLDDITDDLSVPTTKQLLSSRLPITKTLLEQVLSDITEGAIAAAHLSVIT